MLLDLIQDKKTLQISYWGEGGKTFIDTVEIKDEDFFEYLTSPKNTKGDNKDEMCKNVVNWNGQRVYKHKLDPRKDRLNRYRLYEIVDSLPEEQKEKIFSYNIPELFFIDIENKLQEGKPNPENPDKPITVIGICCPNDTIMVLSGGYNLSKKQQTDIQKRIDEHFSQIKRQFKFVFRYFDTEYDMLYFFLKFLVPKMGCMTGWNFEDYDWRYIYNRAKLINIDPTISSPCRRMTGQTERPAHVGLIDYLKAYKKWTWNTNENYRLDTIGEKLIGIKKVQHAENLDDMLNNDFEKYVYYNAIDCCLVKLIHEACNAVTCGLTTSWLGHIRAMDCFSTTYIPENLLRESFRAQGRVLGIDPNKKKGEKGEKYEGAFVKQPVPGLHKHCTCRDYASLYPSLMRQFNIGPETLVKMLPEKDEEMKQEWRDKGYIVCASGAVFQKEDGNLKKIITELYMKRKTYKKTSFKYQQNYYDIKEMISNNVGVDEINDYLVKNEIHNVVNEDGEGRLKAIMSYCLMMSDIYNNYQLGTKVVINGIYGAFGFSGFYFYNKNIAEAVTKQGKHAILNAESIINKWAQKVWLKDKKTHKMMGIKIKPGCENIDIKSITRYIDTDSNIFSTIINVSKDIIIANNVAYNISDSIQIVRNGVDMVVDVSDIQKGDFIDDEKINNIKKTNKLTIEQLYNLGQNDMGSTLAGHESVDCIYDVLNIKQNGGVFERYYANVKRVIRHKVTKAKWSLKDEFGNEVVVTNDHSLMVLRDSILQKVKPCDVDINNDRLVIDDNGFVEIVGIVRCEQIGNFDDEYVYDIEMDDETHTFVANNILVHNSIYSSYTDIIESTDWFDHQVWRLTKVNKQNDQKDFTYVSKGGYPTLDDAKEYFKVEDIDLEKFSYEIDEIEPDGREFCLTMNRVFMSDFLKKVHEEYADKQGTPNILDFELEGYLDAGIWLAKKKYIKNLTWAEPNIYYDSCTKIKPTGVEIAQTSSSPWVKKQLTDMVKWIFRQENFTIEGMANELSKVKKQFMLQSPEIICVNKGMNKYSEYVMNDTDEIELQPKAMVTIQGASFYNHLLNTNEKYKKKYGILSDSDKLCVLYIKPTHKFTYWKKETCVPIKEYVKCPDMYKLVTDKKATIRPEGMGKPYEAFTDVMSKAQVEAISFPAGLYPKDLVISKGIEIDYERMFDLLVLGPMNRIIEAMGNQPISLNMSFQNSLW